ncbi:MAG TPA: hypothetical protein VK988_01130 [Acidimicrobiales bacterium]|nr:hypothetical protein [Acidimicrobiales bacterium]
MVPDIKLLRVERPELEDELGRLEADGRRWIAQWGDPSTTCYGVMIAHEGGWALSRTPPRDHRHAVQPGQGLPRP